MQPISPEQRASLDSASLPGEETVPVLGAVNPVNVSKWSGGILVLAGGAAILVIDQALKGWATESLRFGKVIVVLHGLVRLAYTQNSGAAFGILQTGGILFSVIAGAVVVVILLSLPRAAVAQFPVRLGLALVLGGALGNLVDRVRLGYVVDYIDFGWWPVFNAADVAIVLGVSFFTLTSVLSSSRGHG